VPEPDKLIPGQLKLPVSARSPWWELTRRLLLAIAILVFTVLLVYVDRAAYRDNNDPSTKVGLIDAIYYTTVTLSTTGYGDIAPAEPHARLINAFVITPLRIAFLVLLIGTTLEVLATQGREMFRAARWRKHMENHVVVIGYGTKGRSAVETLVNNGVPKESLVIVDPSSVALGEAHAGGYAVVTGDASRREVLRRAGVERARQIMITTPRDDTTVLATLTVRQLNPDAYIVAAVREQDNVPLVRQSGADAVVTSSDAVGRLVGMSSISPPLAAVLEDLLTYGEGLEVAERELLVTEVGKAPQSLPDQVIAVLRDERVYRYVDPGRGSAELNVAAVRALVAADLEALVVLDGEQPPGVLVRGDEAEPDGEGEDLGRFGDRTDAHCRTPSVRARGRARRSSTVPRMAGSQTSRPGGEGAAPAAGGHTGTTPERPAACLGARRNARRSSRNRWSGVCSPMSPPVRRRTAETNRTSAGHPELLDTDALGRDAELAQAADRVRREADRPAHVGALGVGHERLELRGVRRRGDPVAEVLAGERDEGPGVEQLLDVGQLDPGAADRAHPQAVGHAQPAGVPQHRDDRDHAGATGQAHGGHVPGPGEPTTDRPTQLEHVADPGLVVEVPGDLAPGQALDHQLEQRVGGLGRDRVRPLGGVAVLGAQPQHAVLTGEPVERVGDLEAQPHQPVADPVQPGDAGGGPGAHGSPW
jgi:voltage-gated potassium channel